MCKGSIDMKTANIADVKNHLSSFLPLVELGEEVEIRKRNLPFARVVPITASRRNGTKLGCDADSATATGDLTDPANPLEHWSMLEQNT